MIKKVFQLLSYKPGIGICYGNLASLHNSVSNFKLAIQYCESELIICKEIEDIDGAREAYENLANAYGKTGRYKEAYENHVKYKALTDSIFTAENSKQLGDLKTHYEVEKREAELKIKADAQVAISFEEKQKQNIIIYSVV